MAENQGNPVDAKGSEVPTATAGGFVRSLYEIFTDPMKVFARIDAGLSWWKPFAVICVISMAIGYFITPYRTQALMPQLKQLPPEQMEQALQNMSRFGILGLIMVPIVLFIVYLILAGITHLAVNIMSTRSSFKKALALVSYCGIVTVIEQIISTAVVMSKGVESVESMADLRVSIGPAALAPEAGGVVSALLQSLSVFSIWYYVLLVLGIATVFRMSRSKAIVPVIPVWIIGVVMLIVGTAFGGAG